MKFSKKFFIRIAKIGLLFILNDSNNFVHVTGMNTIAPITTEIIEEAKFSFIIQKF